LPELHRLSGVKLGGIMMIGVVSRDAPAFFYNDS